MQDGKVHRPKETERERMAWFRPMLTECGRTVKPMNVYETLESATGGRESRLCRQCAS